MARQASSRIGGIVGIAIGLIVVVAIVATPVYIGVLQNHRSRVGSEVSSKVESIRRTILNLDENLLRLRSYSVDTADEPVTDFEISADAQGSLNATASALQRVEQADAERGTEMADLRVAQGKPQAQSFSQLVSKQDKLLSDARKELMELQQGSSKDLTSARISAVMKYVEGRLEKNRGDYLLWKAEQALDRATEMANTLQGIGGDRDLALKSKPTELVGMIDSKIAETNDTIETKRDELAKLDATIADFNARIETLDQTARSNRLQMADMQARRASIHDENGQYARLAQAA